MNLDAQTRLSSSQALTATAVGTNTYDLGVARSIGNGNPMAVLFTVVVAADQTTGDEDYAFEVEYSSSADQTSGYVSMGRRAFESGTPAAPAQDADLLVAGFKFAIPIPPTGSESDERYFGARYTLAGTTPTITVTADIVPMNMLDATVDYATAYTIA